MGGRINIPSITKLEEVLDVLLDPEKYKAYLVEFKTAYDLANDRLADLQTKEQADVYLASAAENASLSKRALELATEKAIAIVAKATDEAQRITTGAHQSIHEANLAVTEAKQELHQLEQDKQVFANFLERENIDLLKRQEVLVLKEAAISKLQAGLQLQKERFERAQAVLEQ